MKISSQKYAVELHSSLLGRVFQTDRPVSVETLAQQTLTRIGYVDEAIICLREDESPRKIVGQFEIGVRVEPDDGKLVAFVRRANLEDL